MTLLRKIRVTMIFCLLVLISGPGLGFGQDLAGSTGYLISDVTLQHGDTAVTITVRGNTPPTYTAYELIDPLRLVMDIANADLGPEVQLPITQIHGPVAIVSARKIDDLTPSLIRFEILLNEDAGYAINRQNNDILLAVNTPTPGEMAQPSATDTPSSVIAAAAAAVTPAALPVTTLKGIDISLSGTDTLVRLPLDGPLPAYRYASLAANNSTPARFYLDLPNTKAPGVSAVTKVGSSLARIRQSQRKNGLRLVFDAAGDTLFPFTIGNEPTGLLVTIGQIKTESDPIAGIIAGDLSNDDSEDEETLDDQKKAVVSSPEMPPVTPPKQQIPGTDPSPAETLRPAVTDNFSFAGYNQQRISVDFYKIDLHNVLRLIGEVSGKNIVVDEGVGGSLTLALDNVPWDFALDVVINLKNLQKEERYGTIVISPANKEFSWPERSTDKIDIKVDPLTITKRIETPKEQILAKQFIGQAKQKEKADDMPGARQLYEDAFRQWPDNAELAIRIATILMVHEQHNARAVHYAKEAMKIDADDHDAALLAAIGLANMKKDAEAKEYFDLAVNGEKPPSAALQSYASFLEEGGDYPEALALLDRHEDLYGDTLDTMISQARLHDKNGDRALATQEYRAALLSGYPIFEDLQQYIRARLDMADRK